MAALEAATQPASVSERKDSLLSAWRTLGGRVKPGQGENIGRIFRSEMHDFERLSRDNRWACDVAKRGTAMDSQVMRDLMAPLVFGMIMLVVAVFPLLRGVPSNPLVWLRMLAMGGYGIWLIVFALNTISDMA
jgi:hypothetical protein